MDKYSSGRVEVILLHAGLELDDQSGVCMEKYIYENAAGRRRRLFVVEREDGLLDVAVFSAKGLFFSGSFVTEREALENFLRRYGVETE